jgi:tetratricopeptide (TPR) repeat protein
MSTEQGANRATLEQSLAALRHGDLDAADALCITLMQQSPGDPAVNQLAAAIAFERGNAGEAVLRTSFSLRDRPDHAPTLLLAGRAAHLAGQPQEALSYFRRAATLAPGRAEPAFLVCRTLLELGDAEANSMLGQLLEKFPDDATGWQSIGDTLNAAQKPEAALIAYSRAAAAAPSWTLQLRRGIILQSLGRLDEAVAAFRAAEALAPNRVEPSLKLAHCLKLALLFEDAMRAFERVVELDPTVAEAWFSLGLLAQDRGDWEKALDAYRRALSARPAFPEAAVNLGICYQTAGDIVSAKVAYRTALRLRADTFGRIAQALSSAPVGEIWLDHEALRRSLGA